MPTRTRNAFFRHPSMTAGAVHFDDETYPVAAGVIECPLEIGEGADWTQALPEEVAAHQKALVGGDEPIDEAAGKKSKK